MLIALTGASGFLGRYTAAALRRAGHRVRALDRSSGRSSGGEPVADEWQVGDQVEDVAEALALAVGDESVAGQFYNLVECGMEWREAAEIARELTGSAEVIPSRPNRGPQHRFNPAKAVAFFDQHGNRTALRRGREGVRKYIAALLSELPPNDIVEPYQTGGLV